jgi:hypothetical protein
MIRRDFFGAVLAFFGLTTAVKAERQKRRPCKVCKAPATFGVRNLWELDPTPGENGDLWMTWDIGLAQYYCDAHARPGKATLQDGTVEVRQPVRLCDWYWKD